MLDTFNSILIVIIAVAVGLIITFVIIDHITEDLKQWTDLKYYLFESKFESKPKQPIYTRKHNVQAEDFEEIFSCDDIYHLRLIADHYTSTKPKNADPETVSLAVTLETIGREN